MAQPGNLKYDEILKRLQEHDLDAFEAIYVHARERLFVYACSLLKNEQAAEDLVHELFIDFWEHQLFLNINDNLIGYLLRSVHNRSLTHLKKEHTLHTFKQHLQYLEEGKVVVNDAIDIRELGQEITSAIGELPPMAARVFRLHYLEKNSYQEIAEELGISRHTVSNHMTKALRLLRQILKKT